MRLRAWLILRHICNDEQISQLTSTDRIVQKCQSTCSSSHQIVVRQQIDHVFLEEVVKRTIRVEFRYEQQLLKSISLFTENELVALPNAWHFRIGHFQCTVER